MSTYQALIEKGKAEGISIGEARGKLEGKIEGKREGRLEERQAIARNLKAQGLTLELIVRATGLTPEEVQAL